jgi:hypothetical protein
MNLAISEEERQLILLALAKLSLERPGWDFACHSIALKMDNVDSSGRAEMYDGFCRSRNKTVPVIR